MCAFCVYSCLPSKRHGVCVKGEVKSREMGETVSFSYLVFLCVCTFERCILIYDNIEISRSCITSLQSWSA